jgi:hypothetical protein
VHKKINRSYERSSGYVEENDNEEEGAMEKNWCIILMELSFDLMYAKRQKENIKKI